jgi:broad specificity phosphatase PhoE
MLQLHLVRHGETNFNRESRVQGQFDSILNDTGRLQAQSLRPTIEGLGITSVYSSSNLRARQTTEILNANLALPVAEIDDLREIYMGPWQQRLWSEFRESDPTQFENFMSRPDRFYVEGAERFCELQDRGVQSIEQIISNESSGEVLVVSHGGILKAILAHYLGMELSQMWKEPLLDNCSRSVLKVDEDGDRTIQMINETVSI